MDKQLKVCYVLSLVVCAENSETIKDNLLLLPMFLRVLCLEL